MNKYLLFGLLLSAAGSLFAQEAHTFGELTYQEKGIEQYPSDTTANAVYLYERGDNYFDLDGNRIWLYKTYHAKIKILKTDGFEHGTVSIPYYRGEDTSEKILSIRAITHNGTVRTGVAQDQIFYKDLNPNWSEATFSFPAVQVGSVLEYTYELRSPFIYNLTGWEFQAGIPKVYSEFNARIPGNYVYNRSLVGFLPLDVNEAELERGCLAIPGIAKPADCEKLRYAMKDIPAFEEESFMLAVSNYRARMEFELSEWRRINGQIERFTKTWDDVDSEFRKDTDLGRQLKKENFFEKQVPAELLSGGTDLERAQNIYNFVRTYYNWDGKFGIYRESRVKEAFEKGVGNVAEINMSLINLLNVAGIPTQLVLSATRGRGLPKKNHPVMSDFNYVLARCEIDGTTYILDATDKFTPFGMLPTRALNYYGRVMDFDKDSYWEDFKIEERNMVNIRAQLVLEEDGSSGSGVLYWLTAGYPAIEKLQEKAEAERYDDTLEDSFRDDMEVIALEWDEEKSSESNTYERLDFEISNSITGNRIYLDPFLIRFFNRNPFKLNTRLYPVDFAYPRSYTYSISISVPEGMTVESLPEKQMIALPNGYARLVFDAGLQGNNIVLTFNFNLAASHLPSEYYPGLKDLFDRAVRAQSQSLIVLVKP